MKPNRSFAVGRLKAGVMNKSESAYAQELEAQKHAGLILWYGFEVMTFKLAADTRYTPDFVVMLANNQLQAREVKGFWQGDAKVKIKVASALFPIQFIAIHARSKKDGGGWSVTEF